MTIQDWGAIGEVIGAVAVVATLAYLATQIRYARLAASDASRQARADGVLQMQLAMVTNPEWRAAWYKADTDSAERIAAMSDRLGMTADEYNMLWSGCCGWTFLHWSQFRSMKTADDEQELENLVLGFYSRTPMSTLWEHDPYVTALLDPGFVSWVNEVLAKSR